MLTIADLAVGAHGYVIGYSNVDKNYRRRLLAMGLTPGTKVTLQRVAPFGDPIEVTLRGFALSLRKHEARACEITETQP